MNRSEHILALLQAELGFSAQLIGGKKTVLAQIERFLTRADVPDDLDPSSQPQLWSRLISEVVVPETFFFRYPESFTMLRGWLQNRQCHTLRALCVPCSTGEEAYSIAITLREAGVPTFQIAACDASAMSIARAREGEYSIRSVRGLPEAMLKQWFQSHAGNLTAEDSIRSPITFDTANIFSMETPPGGFDFIFCRNLLIYLDVEKQHLVFERLNRWLKPDGLLFLGPGEATTAASHGWKGTGHPMSFSFVRAENKPPAASARPPVRQRITPPPAKRPLPPPRPLRASPPQPGATNWLASAVELADTGQLSDAMQALARHHESREATAGSLLLRGILEEAQGAHSDAEASYRKALYLEPDHLDTLLHLSLLLESEGRAKSAVPLRRRIERLSAAS